MAELMIDLYHTIRTELDVSSTVAVNPANACLLMQLLPCSIFLEGAVFPLPALAILAAISLAPVTAIILMDSQRDVPIYDGKQDEEGE
jgi:hypothetical protein